MKVVINICYGGFSLSIAGLKRYYEIKFPKRKLYFYNRNFSTDIYTKINEDECNYFYTDIFDKDFGSTFNINDIDNNVFNDHFVSTCEFKRTDPVLVQVVEELGDKANGECAELVVREVFGHKYRICEYDGLEWLETPDSIQWEEE